MRGEVLTLARAVRTNQARIEGSSDASSVPIEEMRTRLGHVYETQATLDQLTGDVNDYDLGARGIKRASSDAARSITGVLAGNDWTEYELWNVGSFNITLKHLSSSSAAANRIACGGSADIVLGPNDGVRMRYDSTSTRWRAWKL